LKIRVSLVQIQVRAPLLKFKILIILIILKIIDINPSSDPSFKIRINLKFFTESIVESKKRLCSAAV